MLCPHCNTEMRVIDTRLVRSGQKVHRRRECRNARCQHRLSTVETFRENILWVLKRSGIQEEFDVNKLTRSIKTAVRKRPINEQDVLALVKRIVAKFQTSPRKKIHTEVIGKEALQELHRLDPVGYIRFASVYLDFQSKQDFKDFLDTELLEHDPSSDHGTR